MKKQIFYFLLGGIFLALSSNDVSAQNRTDGVSKKPQHVQSLSGVQMKQKVHSESQEQEMVSKAVVKKTNSATPKPTIQKVGDAKPLATGKKKASVSPLILKPGIVKPTYKPAMRIKQSN